MKKRLPGQLSLALQTPDTDGWMACRSLFSLNYLKQHGLKTDSVPTAEAAGRLYGKFKALWEEERERLPRQHERCTCSVFLDPILADLGWHSLPEADLRNSAFSWSSSVRKRLNRPTGSVFSTTFAASPSTFRSRSKTVCVAVFSTYWRDSPRDSATM